MAASGAIAQSLYTRLGGYDVIAAFVDNWLALLAPDPPLDHRFGDMTLDERRKVRQLIVDFIAERAGGPVMYAGPTLASVRAGLGMSASDCEAVLGRAEAALAPLGVAPDAKDGLLGFLASLPVA